MRELTEPSRHCHRRAFVRHRFGMRREHQNAGTGAEEIVIAEREEIRSEDLLDLGFDGDPFTEELLRIVSDPSRVEQRRLFGLAMGCGSLPLVPGAVAP